jgi:subtilisin family serine protease
MAAPSPAQNHGLGHQGVQIGQKVVAPFGAKGEKVGLAFRTGFFAPPVGERVQPALRQLARTRAQTAAPATPGVNGNVPAPSVCGFLVLNGRLDDQLKARLTAQGVELYGFYPHTAWRARIPVAALDAVAAMPEVRWVGQGSPGQKLALEMHPFMAQAAVNAKPVSLFVHLFCPDESGTVRAAIEATGAKISMYDKSLGILGVDASQAAINQALNMDAVMYVEPCPVVHAMDAQSMSSINADWLWGVSDPAPDNSASQVKVGIIDTGCYANHADFSNVFGGMLGYSFISGENWYDDKNGHGSFCSGILIGEGYGDAQYRGVAAGLTSHGDPFHNPDYLVAQVLDQTGSGPGTVILKGMQAMNGEFDDVNEKRQVYSCSIGGGVNDSNGNPIASFLVGTDALSIKVDQLFQNNVLSVVAAGNSGDAGNGTVSFPGCAKGAITVGAVYDDAVVLSNIAADGLTGYSGRGNTGDNRVKPDLVAPGSYIDSVEAGTFNLYSYVEQGTSFATPHVAGLVASLLGTTLDPNSHLSWPAEAIKTTMLATAVDLGMPSSQQGQGKADALLEHYDIDGGWYTWWWTNGGTGDLRYIDFNLPSPAARLKLVLTYPDPPPSGGASFALVNDLDLGLQYDSGGGLTTDFAANWYSSSSVDPVEVITVDNAPAGNYRLKVHSYNVSGSQGWAVTEKVIQSSKTPNLSVTLALPHAVPPGTIFTAEGSAFNNNYVATGVQGVLFRPLGFTLDSLSLNRRSKPSSNDEWFYFPNPNPQTAGYYDPNGMNMGDIAQFYDRKLDWQVTAPTVEGTYKLSFTATPSNGSVGAVTNSVIVDGTKPILGTVESLHWGADLNPDVTCHAKDTLAGLNVGEAFYRYSKDGGATWSSPTQAACTGSNGTTARETITASAVPFGQNDPNKNRIQFYAQDMAGNYLWGPSIKVSTGVPAALNVPATIAAGDGASGKVTLSLAAPTDGAYITLTSSNPAVLGVPEGAAVAAGNSTSPAFNIETAAVTADTTVTVTAAYGGVTKTASIKVKTPVTVKGKVLLEGVVNSAQPINFEFRPQDGTASFNKTATLAADGSFSFSGIPARVYKVAVKGHKWLQHLVTVDPTLGTVSNLTINLLAGDIREDNKVDINDLGVLASAFGSTPSSGSWNEAADLNCDGKVDITDLGLLSNNYGKTGDP